MLDFECAALAMAQLGVLLLVLVIVALAALWLLASNAWRFGKQYRKRRSYGYTRRDAFKWGWNYINWGVL